MENKEQSLKKTNKQEAATKLLDFIIFGSIGMIFFLSPIFFTGFTSQGMGFEKMILFYFFALIGTVGWVTKGVIEGELNLKRTPLDLPILGIVVTFVISTIFSVSQKDSLIGSYGNSARGLAAVVVFVLFYYLVVNNINADRIKKLFWLAVSSSGLLILFSLLQLSKIYILPISFTKSASFNTIGSLSGLTMFLVVVLPLLVMAATQMKSIQPKFEGVRATILKAVLGIVILADFAVLALLNGFTFWPVAVVSIVIVLIFLLSKVVKTEDNGLVIPIGIFLLSIILLVLGNFNLINLNLPVEVSLSRSASWQIAKSSLKADPILGSGPSTFYYAFSKFKNPEFNYSPLWDVRFDNASGGLFEILASVGALGALAVIVLVLISISISFLSLIKSEKRDLHPILLGLFAGFISLLIFSLLFSFNNSMILLAVIISILTVSVAVTAYPDKFSELKLSFRTSPKYALALAAIFLSVSAGVVILFTMGLKMLLADTYAKKSLNTAEVSKKIDNLNKSIMLAPYQDAYYLELAKNYMSLANQEASGGRNQNVIENNLSLAIENGRKAVQYSPNNANDNESLALIYENASFYTRGALEWAESYYNKEKELEPNNPVPSLRIALINMARSNAETNQDEKKHYIEEAIKKYDEAIAKKNDLGSAYYGKAIAYEKLSNLNESIEQLKKAVLSSRDNLDYRFELGRLYFNRGVTQPNLGQTATADITKGEGEGDQLSVKPDQAIANTAKRNEDLNNAEQIFLGITQAVPNHANSHYSLALLYQKIGETDKAKQEVATLLNILTDEQQKDLVRKQFPGLY